MPTVETNYMVILVTGIVSMVIGFIWYSKALFAKVWMQEVGLKQEDVDKGPGSGYFWAFVGALITACVLSYFVQYANATTIMTGAVIGFWAWLGFVATSMGMNMIFEQKSMKLFMINAGMQLVNLIVMGAILAVWR